MVKKSNLDLEREWTRKELHTLALAVDLHQLMIIKLKKARCLPPVMLADFHTLYQRYHRTLRRLNWMTVFSQYPPEETMNESNTRRLES